MFGIRKFHTLHYYSITLKLLQGMKYISCIQCFMWSNHSPLINNLSYRSTQSFLNWKLQHITLIALVIVWAFQLMVKGETIGQDNNLFIIRVIYRYLGMIRFYLEIRIERVSYNSDYKK